MKYGTSLLLAAGLMCGTTAPAFASDANQPGQQTGQYYRASQGQQDQQVPPQGDFTTSTYPDGMPEEAYNALRGDGQLEGTVSAIAADDLIGRNVLNTMGQDLGQVERIVADGNRVYLVVSGSDTVDVGELEIALPIDRMIFVGVGEEEQLIMQGLSDEELRAMPRRDASSGQDLGAADQVNILRS